MKKYDQMSVQPENTPARGPRPLAVYAYIEPAKADRLANWLRQNTTNSSITVPNA